MNTEAVTPDLSPAMTKALIYLLRVVPPAHLNIGKGLSFMVARALDSRGFVKMSRRESGGTGAILVTLTEDGRERAEELALTFDDTASLVTAPIPVVTRTPEEEIAFWQAPSRSALLSILGPQHWSRLTAADQQTVRAHVKAGTPVAALTLFPSAAPAIAALMTGLIDTPPQTAPKPPKQPKENPMTPTSTLARIDPLEGLKQARGWTTWDVAARHLDTAKKTLQNAYAPASWTSRWKICQVTGQHPARHWPRIYDENGLPTYAAELRELKVRRPAFFGDTLKHLADPEATPATPTLEPTAGGFALSQIAPNFRPPAEPPAPQLDPEESIEALQARYDAQLSAPIAHEPPGSPEAHATTGAVHTQSHDPHTDAELAVRHTAAVETLIEKAHPPIPEVITDLEPDDEPLIASVVPNDLLAAFLTRATEADLDAALHRIELKRETIRRSRWVTSLRARLASVDWTIIDDSRVQAVAEILFSDDN